MTSHWHVDPESRRRELLTVVDHPLCLETIQALDSLIQGVVGKHHQMPVQISLDVAAAPYVDSDGVRGLQKLRDSLQAEGVGLALKARPDSPVVRTLELLKLADTFRIEEAPGDRQAA